MSIRRIIVDIGPIEIDAYKNTQNYVSANMGTQLQTINSGALTALMGFEQHQQMHLIRDVRFIARTSFGVQCSKISFCSTVTRIRSFHVNNKPVRYTFKNEYTQVSARVEFPVSQ